MYRLRGLRAGVPGEGDLRRGRDAGTVETLHRAEQAVLRRQPRGQALHDEELRLASSGEVAEGRSGRRLNRPRGGRAMSKFMKVATTDELEDQQGKLVEVEGQKIALFRVGEVSHALSDTCTHRGGPL